MLVDNKIAYVSQDNVSRLFCGEIHVKFGKIKEVYMTQYYTELLHWAKIHNAKIVDLDAEERLKKILE